MKAFLAATVQLALIPLVVVSQSVELFIGELNGDVYVEWSGNLTALYMEEPLDDTADRVQLTSDGFLWVAFADTQYSYLTGLPLVEYNFNMPGMFSRDPDMSMGE